MLIQPKQTKYTKYQRKLLKKKNYKNYTLEWRANKLKFGDYGLQALEKGLLTSAQIYAIQQIIKRKLQKEGFFWTRVFPATPFTEKPLESRMGKGKGNISSWGVLVHPGQILFEVTGVSASVAKMVLTQGAGKLPIKSQIFSQKFR